MARSYVLYNNRVSGTYITMASGGTPITNDFVQASKIDDQQVIQRVDYPGT